MGDLVPARGQFGPEPFSVFSRITKTEFPAKYLRDSTGEYYIIDPVSNPYRPYVAPLDYDPNRTASYFSNKLSQVFANMPPDEMTPGAFLMSLYPDLYNAFKQGGWGDRK